MAKSLETFPKEFQIEFALGHFFDDYMCQRQPLFGKEETLRSGLQAIREFQIDFILIPPEWRRQFEQRYFTWLSPGAKDLSWWEMEKYLVVDVRSRRI